MIKNRINQLIFILFLLVISFGYAQQKAKYVFLFIGDGMGDNPVYATEIYQGTINAKKVFEPMIFSQFPIQSFMTTYSANSLITDSAASATALASGFKTNNGMINVSPDLKVKYETIAEKAKKAGYKVGILSSVMIDHATPAGFYAHQNSRNNYYKIALELAESNFDYFAGGGISKPGTESDPNSVINKLHQNGYRYLTTESEIKNLKKGDKKVVAINPGTYSGKEYYWEIDHKPESISLAYLTRKGIELLDNDKGFFMMVEGGKIDWALHSNDFGTALHEILAFNEAVKEAVKFYNTHKDETLIIVTSDHDTGGMGLGNIGPQFKPELLVNQKISSQEFERKLKKLKEENRKVSFKEILQLIKTDFGLGGEEKDLELTSAERKWLYDAYENEFIKMRKVNPDRDYLDHFAEKPFALRVVTVLDTKAGIGWTTEHHTAEKVPVKALGVGQESFSKTIDNTDISRNIEIIMGLKK